MIKRSLLLIAITTTGLAFGQTSMSLSLKEAQQMAADNSYKVLAGEKTAEQAEKQVKETLAIGLPQINARGGYDHFIEIPTTIIPNFLQEFDPTQPEYLETQFGTTYNMMGEIKLDQLLFDAVYFVGLRGARTIEEQAFLGLEKTTIEAKHATTQAYLACLVYEENKRILDETLEVLDRVFKETKAMNEAGFLEAIDVDQQELTLLTTQNELIIVERQLDVGYKTLNFIMGVDINQELDLTSTLNTILEAPEFTNIAITKFEMDSHIDHKMAINNLDRKSVSHKYQKSFYYPQLTGYLSHSQSAQRNEFNLFESGQPWYPTTVWGLNLNVPIWSSGQRHFATQRAQIAYEQAEIELKETSQDLLLGVDQQRENFVAAERKFENETKNLELAKRIFDTSTSKYSEGLSSSFELTQKQSQYLFTQQTYINGLVDLLVARTELNKALNLY